MTKFDPYRSPAEMSVEVPDREIVSKRPREEDFIIDLPNGECRRVKLWDDEP